MIHFIAAHFSSAVVIVMLTFMVVLGGLSLEDAIRGQRV